MSALDGEDLYDLAVGPGSPHLGPRRVTEWSTDGFEFLAESSWPRWGYPYRPRVALVPDLAGPDWSAVEPGDDWSQGFAQPPDPRADPGRKPRTGVRWPAPLSVTVWPAAEAPRKGERFTFPSGEEAVAVAVRYESRGAIMAAIVAWRLTDAA